MSQRQGNHPVADWVVMGRAPLRAGAPTRSPAHVPASLQRTPFQRTRPHAHRRTRRVRRRTGGAGAVPGPRPDSQRAGVCRRAAPRSDAQGHARRAAAARLRHAGARGHRGDAGRARRGLRDSAEHRTHRGRRPAAPRPSHPAARPAAADRRAVRLAGPRPGRAGGRRGALGHGLGRHPRPAGDPHPRRPDPGAVTRVGALRLHAPQRHRRRRGRHRGAASRDASAHPAHHRQPATLSSAAPRRCPGERQPRPPPADHHPRPAARAQQT